MCLKNTKFSNNIISRLKYNIVMFNFLSEPTQEIAVENIPEPQIGGTKRNPKKIVVSKLIPDEEFEAKYANKFVNPKMIRTIIREDADVFTDDGKILLRFRKGVLNQRHVQDFYDNVIDFAMNTTSNRGSTTGSKSKNVYENPKVMSNILGYFDRFPPNYKASFKKAGVKAPLEVRECRFNADNPEKWAKAIPLIQDIDRLYKRYAPDHYKKQYNKARQTPFRIPGTSFTTVTTNVNVQTTSHLDSGDDSDGLGNLVVIENGKYEGGETCFPAFNLGVDVRTGDMLFMNVHEWHSNLPIKLIDKDAKRLSIVSYLRYKLWERTKNKSRKFFENHLKRLRRLTRKANPT